MQTSGDADDRLDHGPVKPQAPVARLARSSSLLSEWHWIALFVAMIVSGGTHFGYPAMRILSGQLGGLALGFAIASRSSHWKAVNPTEWIVIGMILLFVFQLVPLPPELWMLLPGREAIAAVDREVFGQPIWRPITIDSEATWQTFAFLIPFSGAYIAYRSGDRLRRDSIMAGVALGLGLALLLGLLQFAGFDRLHPFPIEADNEFGNGFFTNHNHQATFILTAAVITIAHAKALPAGRFDGRLAVLAVLVVLGTIASGSRTGFVLMVLCLVTLLAWWLASRGRRLLADSRSRRLAWFAGGGAVIALFALSAQVISSGRFTMGRVALLQDQRFEMTPTAWRAIGQFWPTGSGFGTFQVPFRQAEPIESLRVLDIIHAHNDLLEVLIEGGFAALALIIALLARIGWLARSAWSNKGETGRRGLLLSMALAIPLLHSLVDYPLRTMSVSVLFALALAALQETACRSGKTSA